MGFSIFMVDVSKFSNIESSKALNIADFNSLNETSSANEDVSIFASYDDSQQEGADILYQQLDSVEEKQGFFSQTWNGIKEFVGIGTSAAKCDEAIEKYKNGEISFEEASAVIDEFSNKQDASLDLFSNIATGVAAIAAASLAGAAIIASGGTATPLVLAAIGAGTGAVTKTAYKFTDRATNDVEGDVDLCGVCGGGLFCGIENAFVENVVLDSSCSFEGVFAGGLSGCVGGNVSVMNVKTMATTTATQAAGGLFALFHQTTTTTTTTRNDEEDVEQSAPVVQNVLVHANVSIKSTTQTQTTTQSQRRTTEESIACGVCDKVSSGCVNVVVFGGGSVGGGTQNHNLWAQTIGNQQQQQAHQNIFVVQQGEEQGEQEGVEGNASVVVFDENKQCFVVVDTQHLQSRNNNNEGEETKQQVCVDKELNQVVQQQRWGAAWLSTLDLVSSFSVTFGQPASVSTSGSPGKTMLDVVKDSSKIWW